MSDGDHRENPTKMADGSTFPAYDLRSPKFINDIDRLPTSPTGRWTFYYHTPFFLRFRRTCGALSSGNSCQFPNNQPFNGNSGIGPSPMRRRSGITNYPRIPCYNYTSYIV
jgi:hypothetical protein